MSNTLLVPAGVRAESGKSTERQLEPALRSESNMYPQYRHDYAQELLRERLRQAEAQRLRRAAWRARRGLAAKLLG